MHIRTATLLLAATALLAGCSSQPTYDESVTACTAALKARPKPEPTKPKPCERLKEDDYTLLVAQRAMEDLGWTDKNGNLDQNKMLRSTPRP